MNWHLALRVTFGILFLNAPAVLLAQIEEQPASALLTKLSSGSLEERRDAVYELVRRQDHSRAVIEGLASQVDESDEQIQFQALMGLGRAGKAAKPATKQLIDVIDDRSDQVRYRAAVALGAIGESAIPDMLSRWKNANEEVKIALADAFRFIASNRASDSGEDLNASDEASTDGAKAAIEDALQVLRDSLDDGSPELRSRAAQALVALIPNEVELAFQLSNHEQKEVRKVGIQALAALPTADSEVQHRLQVALDDSDPKIRETVILALGSSSLAREAGTPLFKRALVDSEASVRSATLAALEKADLLTPSMATTFVDMLSKTPEPEIAEFLVKSLGRFGEAASETLPDLVELSIQQDIAPEITADTVARFGPASVKQLIGTLESNPEAEVIVAKTLAALGNGAKGTLVDALSDANERVRIAAANALSEIRPLDVQDYQGLLELCQDDSRQVRQSAISALSITFGDPDAGLRDDDVRRQCQAKLMEAISGQDPPIQALALRSLSQLDITLDTAEELLSPILSSSEPSLQVAGLQALVNFENLRKRFVPSVIDLSSSSDESVRLNVMHVLAKLDDSRVNPAVIGTIEAGLQDDSSEVRIAATQAAIELQQFSPEIVERVAANLVLDEELLLASLAYLEESKADGGPYLGALKNLLAHRKEAVRIATVKALAALSRDRANLTAELTDVLRDSEWTVRQSAAAELAELGSDAASAVPVLFQMIKNEEDQSFATHAIREIDSVPKEALPMLLDNLESEDYRTSFYAVFLIGKLGADAQEALPRLEQLLKDSGRSRRGSSRKRFLTQAIDSIRDASAQEDD